MSRGDCLLGLSPHRSACGKYPPPLSLSPSTIIKPSRPTLSSTLSPFNRFKHCLPPLSVPCFFIFTLSYHNVNFSCVTLLALIYNLFHRVEVQSRNQPSDCFFCVALADAAAAGGVSGGGAARGTRRARRSGSMQGLLAALHLSWNEG